MATRVGEKEAEILQGHIMLLSDPMLTGEIENSIKNDGVNSEFAIETVCNMYADMFASMGDELMPVSYTHLDVYKRQAPGHGAGDKIDG